MNQKTLVGLAIAALLAVLAAVVLNRTHAPRSEERAAATTWLAPTLRDHVNNVKKVIVTAAGDKTLATLEQRPTGWVLTEKDGYPVDTGKLREFLLKLADAKLVEPKTSSSARYATLGVEDVSAKDAKGLQVELDGLAQSLKLIIGNADPRGGTFVRRVGDAQSWLASGTLSVEKTAVDWLKKDLIDIPADHVAAVVITHPDGAVVRVSKDAPGETNFKLADIPKGREAGAEYAINGLASTLAALRFDDVLQAKDASSPANALTAHFAMFDGIVVDMIVWQNEGKDEARFSATLDAQQAEKGIPVAQAKARAEFETAAEATRATRESDASAAPIKPLASSDPAKDHDDRLVALNRQVADLNSRFNGWIYVLPTYKYSTINKSIDDLLKPLETRKAAGSAKSAAASGKSAASKRGN